MQRRSLTCAGRGVLFALLTIGAVCGPAVALANLNAARRDRETLRAEQFVLEDDEGRVRASLALDRDGMVVLKVYPPGAAHGAPHGGSRAAALALTSDGSDRMVYIRLGANPTVALKGESGKPAASVGLQAHGPLVTLFDGAGQVRAWLGLVGDRCELVIFDENGKLIWEAPTPAEAVKVPTTGELVGVLPGGAELGLVAVSRPEDRTQWWRPDGSVIDDPEWIVTEDAALLSRTGQTEKASSEQHGPGSGRFVYRRFVFRASPLEPPPVVSAAVSGQKQVRACNVHAREGGVPLPWACRVVGIPDSTESADLAVRAAAGQYRSYPLDDVPPRWGTAKIVRTYEENGSAAAQVITSLSGCQWRLVAEADDGAVRAGQRRAGRWQLNSGVSRSIWLFEGLSVDRVEQISLELRPYYRVDFGNVSLKPGHRSEPNVALESETPR